MSFVAKHCELIGEHIYTPSIALSSRGVEKEDFDKQKTALKNQFLELARSAFGNHINFNENSKYTFTEITDVNAVTHYMESKINKEQIGSEDKLRHIYAIRMAGADKLNNVLRDGHQSNADKDRGGSHILSGGIALSPEIVAINKIVKDIDNKKNFIPRKEKYDFSNKGVDNILKEILKDESKKPWWQRNKIRWW